MFESILHFIGICPDSASHFDLIDLLINGFGGTIYLYYNIFVNNLKKILYNIRKNKKV